MVVAWAPWTLPFCILSIFINWAAQQQQQQRHDQRAMLSSASEESIVAEAAKAAVAAAAATGLIDNVVARDIGPFGGTPPRHDKSKWDHLTRAQAATAAMKPSSSSGIDEALKAKKVSMASAAGLDPTRKPTRGIKLLRAASANALLTASGQAGGWAEKHAQQEAQVVALQDALSNIGSWHPSAQGRVIAALETSLTNRPASASVTPRQKLQLRKLGRLREGQPDSDGGTNYTRLLAEQEAEIANLTRALERAKAEHPTVVDDGALSRLKEERDAEVASLLAEISQRDASHDQLLQQQAGLVDLQEATAYELSTTSKRLRVVEAARKADRVDSGTMHKKVEEALDALSRPESVMGDDAADTSWKDPHSNEAIKDFERLRIEMAWTAGEEAEFYSEQAATQRLHSELAYKDGEHMEALQSLRDKHEADLRAQQLEFERLEEERVMQRAFSTRQQQIRGAANRAHALMCHLKMEEARDEFDKESKRRASAVIAVEARRVHETNLLNARNAEALHGAREHMKGLLNECESRRLIESAITEDRRLLEGEAAEKLRVAELEAAALEHALKMESAAKVHSAFMEEASVRLSELDTRRIDELTQAEDRRVKEVTAAEGRRVAEAEAAEARRLSELEALQITHKAEMDSTLQSYEGKLAEAEARRVAELEAAEQRRLLDLKRAKAVTGLRTRRDGERLKTGERRDALKVLEVRREMRERLEAADKRRVFELDQLDVMSRLAIKAIEDREEHILEPTKAKHREELEAVKEGHRKSMLAQEQGFRGQIKTMQEAHKVAMEKEKAKYKKLKLGGGWA